MPNIVTKGTKSSATSLARVIEETLQLAKVPLSLAGGGAKWPLKQFQKFLSYFTNSATKVSKKEAVLRGLTSALCVFTFGVGGVLGGLAGGGVISLAALTGLLATIGLSFQLPAAISIGSAAGIIAGVVLGMAAAGYALGIAGKFIEKAVQSLIDGQHAKSGHIAQQQEIVDDPNTNKEKIDFKDSLTSLIKMGGAIWDSFLHNARTDKYVKGEEQPIVVSNDDLSPSAV